MPVAETEHTTPRLTVGRRVVFEGAMVVATLGLATALFLHRGEPLSEGMEASASFLLIARDARSAECAADLGAGEYQCRYDASMRPSADPEEDAVIPLNGNRGLMLLDGFFEQPDVRERVRRELTRVGRPSHEAFQVDCRVRALRRVGHVAARWRHDDWVEGRDVWLASVLQCDVRE